MRPPPELRPAKIATLKATNRYPAEQFVPDDNARVAVPAAEEGSTFTPYAGRPLADILCVEKIRQVGRDNCAAWNGISLQISPQRHRYHSVNATARVHHYPDGRRATFDGSRCRTRFDPNGKPIDAPPAAQLRSAVPA